MDHVSANPSVHPSTREHISSMRVFDGEDQGKWPIVFLILHRCWQQIQTVADVVEGLVRATDRREKGGCSCQEESRSDV